MEATRYPEARDPAYILQIDFGPKIGILKSSAQITELYSPENLLDRQIIAIVNFPPKQIGKIKSQCLVLGSYSDHGVCLLMPDKKVKNGDKIG